MQIDDELISICDKVLPQPHSNISANNSMASSIMRNDLPVVQAPHVLGLGVNEVYGREINYHNAMG